MLDKWNVKYMRKMLGKLGVVERPDGTTYQKSNTQIRELMQTHALGSILRKRRLDWLRDIITNPRENKQLRAAVFGSIENKPEPQGVGENPWIQQWEQDLRDLAQRLGKSDTLAHILRHGRKARLVQEQSMRWFTAHSVDTKLVLTRDD